MLETSARLLRLLSILQTRRDWSGRELAERLGVTDRTVRRDVEKLRGLGYPVHASTGTAGGYRLAAGAALPPLLFDDDEAVAVAVGLRSAAAGAGVAGIEEPSVRALAKLEQMLPARLRHQVSAVAATTVALVPGGASVDAATLTAIGAACRDHLRLRVSYRGPRGDEADQRTLEPHRLVHTGRRWYLVAFDVDKQDWRTFRVDRLTPLTPAGPRFVPRDPPDEDLGAYLSRNLSTAAYPYRARVTVHAAAEAVTGRVSPTAATVAPVDEHHCELRAGAHSLDLLALHLGLIGFELTVHEPPELVEAVRRMGERLTRAGTPPPSTVDANRRSAGSRRRPVRGSA